MIIDISIENFLSIKEKVKLSLEATSSKKIPKNLIKLDEKNILLKSLAIYGANASGKSNMIRAIFFIWDMVVNSSKKNVGDKIARIPFKLDSSYEKKPSKFELNFIYKGVKYTYGFSCDNEKIIDEYLYYSPKGRKALLFRRRKTTNFIFNADRSKQEKIAEQTLNNTLYLSRATQLKYERTKNVYEFFQNNIVINYSPVWNSYTVKKIHENPKLKDKIIQILQKADFGGIEDVKVNKEKKKTKVFMFEIQKEAFSRKEEEADFYEVKFSHKKKNIDDKELIIDFDINEESDGTRKLFAMLGPILDILETGKILFIDEIESSLHPEIIKLLIRLFNNAENKCAQLVFTTHNTTLLDSELFRKDQIYFTIRKPNESTKLSSLSDYNLRQEADFERAYLNGRFGGVPFIDETLFD